MGENYRFSLEPVERPWKLRGLLSDRLVARKAVLAAYFAGTTIFWERLSTRSK
ncbi:uncharacterized protein METZ01_LOCUS453766, partial [marine metagenome]